MKIIKLLSLIGLSCCVLLGSLIEVAAGREETSPSGIPLEDLPREIDRFMDKHIGSSSVGASVAIAKDGEIILSKGYGYANADQKIKVTGDTVFEYGSISKLFVWTSILKLVEAGQINLDHNIKEYLPESFNKKFNPKYPISLRNIMNHSSGFGEYPFDLLQTQEPDYQIKLEDALSQAHPRQYYRPGTLSAYSNYATALAALVVEHLTQTSFDSYEKEQIFQPLAMMQTAGNWTWKDNPAMLKNKAEGYVKAGNQFKKIGWSYVPLYPAGSVNGTAEDLCRFAIDLMQPTTSKLLKNETIQQIFQKSAEDMQTGTSYGFFTYQSHSGLVFGHGGNTAGFSSQLTLDPKSKFAMVVLINTAGEIEITAGLQELLFGDSMNQVHVDQVNLPDVKTFAGNYVTTRISAGTPLEFFHYLNLASVKKIADNKLSFNLSGMQGEYLQTQPGEFQLVKASHPFFKLIFSHLRFQKDESGNYQALFGNGQDFIALKNRRSLGHLIGYVAVLLLAILYFLIMPIYNLITRSKLNTRPGLWFYQFGLNLIGLTTLIAAVIYLSPVFLTPLPLIKSSSTQILQAVLWLLLGLASAGTIRGIKLWKQERFFVNKKFFALSVIMIFSLFSLLFEWSILGFSFLS